MKETINPDAQILEAAWKQRENDPLFNQDAPLRIFFGPGETDQFLKNVAIDRLGSYAWVTLWETVSPALKSTIADFLSGHRFKGAVILHRPEQGLPPPTTEILFGEVPAEPLIVREHRMRLEVHLRGSRHPGIFLDHEPLRYFLQTQWKPSSAPLAQARVLNLFAYTGSLSVAAALAGAGYVHTTDLSKTTIEWAERNWALNELPKDQARFEWGDTFDLLPKLKKRNELFDLIIMDPPSFSRGKRRVFSTQKDLIELHALALQVLKPGGELATSINSASVPRDRFWSQILDAANQTRCRVQKVQNIEQPSSFPCTFGFPDSKYLKGWIVRKSE